MIKCPSSEGDNDSSGWIRSDLISSHSRRTRGVAVKTATGSPETQTSANLAENKGLLRFPGLYGSHNALVQTQTWRLNMKSAGLYLHLILVEADDGQGLSHHLPVVAIIDGAHFRTVTLRRKSTLRAKPYLLQRFYSLVLQKEPECARRPLYVK